MDKIKEERERGVTIDLAYKKIMTQKFQITIAGFAEGIHLRFCVLFYHRIGPFFEALSLSTAMYSRMRFLTFSRS